jgi:hypothetical protein
MKCNNNNNSKDSSAPYDVDQIKCLKETLTRSLQMLKISHHNNQISKRAFEFMEKATSEQIKTYGNWILALNAISDYCLISKQHILSHSKVYDFLTIAVATNIEDEKRRTKAIDDIIFRIYSDIMANYQSSNDALKIAYPKIIVDVIAILAKGIDTEGKKIAMYNIESYYQTRKVNASASTAVVATTPTAAAASTSATAASIDTIKTNEEKVGELASIPLSKSKPASDNNKNKHQNYFIIEDEKLDIIKSLNKITGRSKNDLEVSLSKLQRIDIIRIKDLCKNYGKLQNYSKIIHGSEQQQKFKAALEKDTGRKLTDHQLQHATNSIKKAGIYIENILDDKFIPHGAYGINHVKHNLKYGYQLIGIIQSRKRTPSSSSTSGIHL